MRKATIRILLIMATCVFTLQTSVAELLPEWPIEYEVLKSDLIVQGRLTESNQVVVEKVFFGFAKPSEQIPLERVLELPSKAFKDMESYLNYRILGSKEGPSVKGEKVVLFLHHRDKDIAVWQPYGWGSGVKWIQGDKVYGYYQSDSPGPYVLLPDREATNVDELYQTIENGLQKRAKYEAALNEKDIEKKIERLVEFLGPSEWKYFREALGSLEALGPAAGKALRELAELPEQVRRRSDFLVAIGVSKDRDSISYLLHTIAKAKPIVKNTKGKFDWANASEEQQRAMSDWDLAIHAAAAIGDKRALPAFREALMWGAAHENQRMIEHAARGLTKFPTEENLPAFEKAFELYPRGKEGFGKWAVEYSLISLIKHKFTETVPILASQLDHPDERNGRQAHQGLVGIVGEDLGQDKEPWLEWYEANKTK